MNPVLALAGGVGGGKLARGLAAVLAPQDLVIAVNTADDFTHLGLHISPDIDSVLYALADLNDPERGWGLAGETWHFMDALGRLGGETWFRLGDRDLATHVLRTQELARKRTLSDVTSLLAHRFGIAHTVVPMSDDPVRSLVDTSEGAMPFQDYFVRRQCEPAFHDVIFEGTPTARPATGFASALGRARVIVIAPSNPFVSIEPMLAVSGVRDALLHRQAPVVAVSPIVGGGAVKGPLAKMMRERGMAVSPLGIAEHYRPLVDGWIIDNADRADAQAIEKLGCHVHVCDTLMRTLDDKARLARTALDFAAGLSPQTVS